MFEPDGSLFSEILPWKWRKKKIKSPSPYLMFIHDWDNLELDQKLVKTCFPHQKFGDYCGLRTGVLLEINNQKLFSVEHFRLAMKDWTGTGTITVEYMGEITEIEIELESSSKHFDFLGLWIVEHAVCEHISTGTGHDKQQFLRLYKDHFTKSQLDQIARMPTAS